MKSMLSMTGVKNEIKEKNCKGCKYKKIITAQDGWTFAGCTYGEYKGKILSEIDICQKYENNVIEKEIELF